MPRYTIGLLASEADVPTSTVRYYERIGLLKPCGRTASNYRFYDAQALERLRFIRAAQATGFALEDVSVLLDVREGARAPCGEVRELIEDRLETVAQRLADLAQVKRLLKASLKRCREAEDEERCAVLEKLTSSSTVSEI